MLRKPRLSCRPAALTAPPSVTLVHPPTEARKLTTRRSPRRSWRSSSSTIPGSRHAGGVARAAAAVSALTTLVVTLLTVTTPALASAPCSNEGLRAEQAYGLSLPDCRAYEMVSPLRKGDDGVSSIASRAAASGDAASYFSRGSFANPMSALLEGRYLSRRGMDGWSTQNISPPYDDYRTNALSPPFEELLFDEELSSGLVQSLNTPLVGGQPAGYINLYVADTEDGSYQAVSNVTPEKEIKPFTEEGSPLRPQAEGASNDLSHVVFQQQASLVKGASLGHEHVYEWVDGELHLVDVAPPEGRFDGDDNVGAPADQDEPRVFGDTWHAVSSDGSRVFFTDGVGSELIGQLYVRKNPASGVENCLVAGDACTVEVSASQRTDCNVQRKAKEPGYVCTDMPEPDPHGPQPAYFRDASADGWRVFFVSKAELTDDADTGSTDNAANLYEYDLNTGILTDLTADRNPEDGNGAEMLGLVTASEDGSYVYFVANGVLAPRATKGNCKLGESEAPVVGGRTCGLYVLHRSESGWEAPRFIAMLAGGNVTTYAENDEDGDEADWIGYELITNDYGPGRHSVRVVGDGTRLVFESELSLTGFDNAEAKPGECGESGRCREVYLYHVNGNGGKGSLVCVSCDPGFDGGSPALPVGRAALGGHEGEAGSMSEPSPFYLPRNLSDGGQRLFFESPDALVPGDSNGLLDVYEWEQPATPIEAEKGENSCTPASSGYRAELEGCVFPISDVAGSYASHFMDASANGNDVFIATTDQLLPSDTDFREDVYAARVGGGFPVAVATPVCTNADSCKPGVSAQPDVFGAPASATFSGPGSPLPTPVAVKKPVKKAVKCAKNEKLNHGRCVKKKRQKSKKTTRRAKR